MLLATHSFSCYIFVGGHNMALEDTRAFKQLVELVNRSRYRGPDGTGPMTDRYRWPMDIPATQSIAQAALKVVVEASASDETTRQNKYLARPVNNAPRG